ncbi:MAG: 16S rRNA (guanine(527)-N(7))-methyltransferase RsmG [Actinomycetota bacterium]|nr:16S rRNA (guanine(527)-N(7))-methyltransferase RsmG [Actinomycetota bacterium]
MGTRDKPEIVVRHFLDCLSILQYKQKYFKEATCILDIGSGGGLPGMLLSFYLPHCRFFLLEKSLKKTEFLNQASLISPWQNVEIVRGRAELLAREHKYREKFETVLARAVTSFKILIELAIPFCKINGKIIFYKSRKVFEEINSNAGMIEKLGGKIGQIHQVEVDGLNEFRALLEIEKVSKTPDKYPRNFAKIKRG